MTNEQKSGKQLVADWTRVDLASAEGQRDFLEALQRYMDEKPEPNDTGWMEVFEVIDFTGTRKNSFDIVDVSSGLVFRAVRPGEKALVYKVSGEKVIVDFDLYGGALGWSKLWFDDEEYRKIDDAAREFRARWYANKAQAHYDLLSASRPDSDVAWQGMVDDDKAVRDAETINYACAAILDDMRDLGFDVNANSTFVVVSPVQLLSRMRNALRTTLLGNVSSGIGEGAEVNFNVKLTVTSRLKNQALTAAETSSFLVALPGRKIKSGNRMDLTVLSETDVLAYAETVAGWGRYGAIVGEVSQIRRCSVEDSRGNFFDKVKVLDRVLDETNKSENPEAVQKTRARNNAWGIFEVMEALLLAAQIDPATAPLFKDEAWKTLFEKAETLRKAVRNG